MAETGNPSSNPEHAIRLTQILYRWAKRQKFTDFIIKAADTTKHCHSLVLCAQSSYIDGLCARGAREAELINFQSATQAKQILEQTVRYLYLGTMELTEDIVEPVLQAAQQIDNMHMKDTCEEYMVSVLSVENCPEYIENAQKFDLVKLSHACEEFQKQNFNLLINEPWFLPSLTLQDLLNYLMDDDLGVTQEEQVLVAVNRWMKNCTANDEVKQEYMNQLIPYVRLSECDRDVLESAVRPDNTNCCACLKVKIQDYLHGKDVRGRENPTHDRLQEEDTPGAENPHDYLDIPHRTRTRTRTRSETLPPIEERKVIVGGRLAGNQAHPHIIDLDHERKLIPFPEEFKDCDFYSVCASDTSVFLSGGYDPSQGKTLSAVYQYCFFRGEWSELHGLPSARYRHGSVVIGNFLYIIGGVYKEDIEVKRWYRKVHVLNLTDFTWATVQDLTNEVRDPGVAVVNGEIYVMRGVNADGVISKKVVKYQPHTDQWCYLKDMPSFAQASVHATVSVGKRIFVLAQSKFLLYDTEQNQWSNLEAPPIPSFMCSMLHLDGNLLVMGGINDPKSIEDPPHDRLQSYDLRRRKWSLLQGTMPVALSYHSSFMMRVPRSS